MPPSPCHPATAAIAPRASGLLERAGRHGLFLLGGLSFATGTLGLVVPLLPTTIFWIIAAWLAFFRYQTSSIDCAIGAIESC